MEARRRRRRLLSSFTSATIYLTNSAGKKLVTFNFWNGMTEFTEIMLQRGDLNFIGIHNKYRTWDVDEDIGSSQIKIYFKQH